MKRLCHSALFVLLAACQFDLSRSLEPGELRGRAVFQDEAGALVPATDVVVRVEGSSITVRGDAKGNFVIRNLPPGRYSLRIEQGSDAGLRLRNIDLADGRHLGDLVVGGLGSMGGKVLEHNEPIEGRVVLGNTAEGRISTGDWRIQKLLPGDYDLFVQTNDGRLYVGPSITVRPREAVVLDLDVGALTLVTTGSLEGHARLAGRPNHEGIRIQAMGAQNAPMLTDSSGFYAEGGLTAGVYTVFAKYEGFRTISLPLTVITPDSILPDLILTPTDTPCAPGGGQPGDTDEDADGVPDVEEPAVCVCHPGHEDADGDGVCDNPGESAEDEPEDPEDPEEPEEPGDNECPDGCPSPSFPALCVGALCVDTAPLPAMGDVVAMTAIGDTSRALVVFETGFVYETDGEEWLSLGRPGSGIASLLAPSAEKTWLVDQRGALFARNGNTFEPLAQLDPESYAYAQALGGDSNENLWLATDQGLWRLSGTTFVAEEDFEERDVSQVATGPGVVYAADSRGLWRKADSVWEPLYSLETYPGESPHITSLHVSPSGDVWFGVHSVNWSTHSQYISLFRYRTSGGVEEELGLYEGEFNSDMPSIVTVDGTGDDVWTSYPLDDRTHVKRHQDGAWTTVEIRTGRSRLFGEGEVRLNDLSVATNELVWLLSSEGTLLRFTPTALSHPVERGVFDFADIAARTADDVIALAPTGLLMRWQGNGWEPILSPPGRVVELSAGSGQLYALTDETELFKWSDGGWTFVYKPEANLSARGGEPISPNTTSSCPDDIRVLVANDGDIYLYGQQFDANCSESTVLTRLHEGVAETPYLDFQISDVQAFARTTSNEWVLDRQSRLWRLTDVAPEQLGNFAPDTIRAAGSRLYAIEPTGRLATRTDDDETWTYANAPWSDVWGSLATWSDDSGALVVLDPTTGSCYQTDGIQSDVLELPRARWNALDGPSSNDLWFAGPGLLHYDGNTFTTGFDRTPLPRYRAVAPYSSEGAFALTDDGAIQQRSKANGWTTIARPPSVSGNFSNTLMRARNANDLWLVSLNAPLWTHFDGETWKIGSIPTQSSALDMWTDTSSEIFVLYPDAVYRWNPMMENFAQVEFPSMSNPPNDWRSLNGPTLSALRAYDWSLGLLRWNSQQETFEPEPLFDLPGAPAEFNVNSIISLGDDHVLALDWDNVLYEYTTTDGWQEIQHEGLPQGLYIQDLLGAGGRLWGATSLESDQSNDTLLRLKDGHWDAFESPLKGSPIENLQVVDGTAWFIQNNAVVRLSPDTDVAAF